jgi:LacI family transcriptional regulator
VRPSTGRVSAVNVTSVKRVTIREVAEAAGVSVGTVSNALNQPGIVADETLSRILKVIEEIGFVRNAAARQLRGSNSPAIGLIVLDIDNPFFTAAARGVEDAANAVDHLVILCNSAGDRERESRQLRLLEEQRVSGVLLTPAGRRASAAQQRIRERGTPVVLLDRRSARGNGCSVAVDDVRGGNLAGLHLAELGHTRIGLINGPREITQCVNRRTGFLAALEQASLQLTSANDIEMSALTIAAGEEATAKLLAVRNPPTGVFCANDLMALGAQYAAVAAGLRIPEDIAIVGYDDVPFAGMSLVPLTSVRQPAYELGHRAAELLFDEASGLPHQHEQVLFRPELVVRESTVGAKSTRRNVLDTAEHAIVA